MNPSCVRTNKQTGVIGRAKAPKGKISSLILDLADFSSIHAFAKDLVKKKTEIDVLVNNAGALFVGRVVFREWMYCCPRCHDVSADEDERWTRISDGCEPHGAFLVDEFALSIAEEAQRVRGI